MARKKGTAYWLKFHDDMVRQILDTKEHLPWAQYETHWFTRGQKHYYRNKAMRIETDKPILVSSYLEVDGITVRIINHEKKNGYAPGTRVYIYDEMGKFYVRQIPFPNTSK